MTLLELALHLSARATEEELQLLRRPSSISVPKGSQLLEELVRLRLEGCLYDPGAEWDFVHVHVDGVLALAGL